MTFAQTMRLIWIDAMLSKVGHIRRADICRSFRISVPQASIDLRAYQKALPTGLTYDVRAKCYRRAGSESLFDEDAQDAVGRAVEEVHHWTYIQLS